MIRYSAKSAAAMRMTERHDNVLVVDFRRRSDPPLPNLRFPGATVIREIRDHKDESGTDRPRV